MDCLIKNMSLAIDESDMREPEDCAALLGGLHELAYDDRFAHQK